MESIISYFASLGLDFWSLLKIGGIFIGVILLFGLFGRIALGKKSVLNNAVSSAIGILFIYLVTVILNSAGIDFEQLTAPLPFVTLTEDQLILFSFTGAHYTAVFSQLASMLILALLVNLVDGWLPMGKNLLSWLFFRGLTVIIAYVMHLLVVWLFNTYLPEGIVIYAPAILLGLLVLLILTGALKLIVGALLATVNPLIAGLYTFFFANAVGKQITKAVFTTTLLAGLVMLLNYLGCGVISIVSAALIVYVPFILILIALWYLVAHVL